MKVYILDSSLKKLKPYETYSNLFFLKFQNWI